MSKSAIAMFHQLTEPSALFSSFCKANHAKWIEMTLGEIVGDLASFDRENTIYVSEPWTADSEAIVAPEPESDYLPPDVQRLNMKYFLEVFIARDVLDDWTASLQEPPTLEGKCARLIDYAINDA